MKICSQFQKQEFTSCASTKTIKWKLCCVSVILGLAYAGEKRWEGVVLTAMTKLSFKTCTKWVFPVCREISQRKYHCVLIFLSSQMCCCIVGTKAVLTQTGGHV